jgi:hypothetical protein
VIQSNWIYLNRWEVTTWELKTSGANKHKLKDVACNLSSVFTFKKNPEL